MTSETCLRCAHPVGDHAMLNFTGEVRDGGIFLCPVKRCPCYGTWGWGKNAAPPTNLPSEAEIQKLRAELQAGELE